MLLDRLFYYTVECFKNGCQYSIGMGIIPALNAGLAFSGQTTPHR